MKQCTNCKEWISKEYQYCPVCGENQSTTQDLQSKSNNTSCFLVIIILLVLAIVGGIFFYMYNRGAFNEYFTNESDTTLISTTTEIIEQGLPSELHLTTVNFLNNEKATIDLKISSNGNVSGKFHMNGSDKNLTGSGNKEDGVINVKNTKEAISLTLTPLVDNYGKYDCAWEYKGKAGNAYFYPTENEESDESPEKSKIPSFDPNKIVPRNNVTIDTISIKTDTTSYSTRTTSTENISSIKLSGKLDGRIQIEMNLYDLKNGRGNYYYTSQGANRLLSLSCHYNNNGSLTMIERDENGNVTGKFSGKLIDGVFTGIFENNKDEVFSVVLRKK